MAKTVLVSRKTYGAKCLHYRRRWSRTSTITNWKNKDQRLKFPPQESEGKEQNQVKQKRRKKERKSMKEHKREHRKSLKP